VVVQRVFVRDSDFRFTAQPQGKVFAHAGNLTELLKSDEMALEKLPPQDHQVPDLPCARCIIRNCPHGID
jgi:hypothetical protein